jgi:hypothetical protein
MSFSPIYSVGLRKASTQPTVDYTKVIFAAIRAIYICTVTQHFQIMFLYRIVR